MAGILVYEPLSAGDPATSGALVPGSPAHAEMLAAGQAMRDALVADLSQIAGLLITVAVREQDARHRAWGAQVRTISALPGEGAVALVRRQAPLHDLCWVVAPESEGLLLHLYDAIGPQRWIGCSAGAIRLAGSKRATCDALERAGIRTPLSMVSEQRAGWIVKPDDGAGSTDTRWHATRDSAEADLSQRALAGHDALVQPFVDGEALSISLVVGPDLARPLAFNRQRIAMAADGHLHDLGVQPAAIALSDPRVPALRALAMKVEAAIPGLRGFVGIDAVWNEREGPVVIEVNPRVTCAYVGLSAILQCNLAAEVLLAHAHRAAHEVADHVGA
jgi:predicted ATP-grasp superfamily ATP-dependent carboligase